MDNAQPMHILIVEDDADSRANLQDILELNDHHVETAASASEMFAPGTGRSWTW